jgi:hypothetical protein
MGSPVRAAGKALQQAVEEAWSYSQLGARRYPGATVTKPSLRVWTSKHLFPTCLLAALIGFGTYFDHVASVGPTSESAAALQADLAGDKASPEVHRVAQWATGSQDHAGLPFVVVDAGHSRLFAFDPQGHFLGSTTVVLDASRSEHLDAAPMAARFVAEGWRADADGGIMCTEHAAFGGSLRVPSEFYREYLNPLLTQTSIGYVLPGVFLPQQEAFRLDELQTWLGASLFPSQSGSTRRRPS